MSESRPTPCRSESLSDGAFMLLRRQAMDAIRTRDGIDSCVSPEWMEAHRRARTLCLEVDHAREILARDPVRRYGLWRSPADIELVNYPALKGGACESKLG